MEDESHSQVAPRLDGTDTTRTVLSALPDTSNTEFGLKRIVVGGNSCAFRIVNSGCKTQSQTMNRAHDIMLLQNVPQDFVNQARRQSDPKSRTRATCHRGCRKGEIHSKPRSRLHTDLISKQVTPRSLTWRTFVTFQVSVSHLQTKARRGDDLVRVRGGTVFETEYTVFSSKGWNLTNSN